MAKRLGNKMTKMVGHNGMFFISLAVIMLIIIAFNGFMGTGNIEGFKKGKNVKNLKKGKKGKK
tara:strand:- start:1850 stop:2038 length:189 start_codon:yes stop_codon:yes gene_type:complete